MTAQLAAYSTSTGEAFQFWVLGTVAVIGNASLKDFDGLAEANANGNVQGLAALIFTKYVFTFEITGALLITAAVGAMVLTHRERTERAKTQRELSEQRVREGKHVPP